MTQALPAAQNRTLWTTGFVSPTTRSELTARGIGAEETIFSARLADKITIVEPKEATPNSAAPVTAEAEEKFEPSGLQNMFNSLGSLFSNDDASKTKGANPN
jgi:hypothetical protein